MPRWALIAIGGLCTVALLQLGSGVAPKRADVPRAVAQEAATSSSDTSIDLGHIQIVGDPSLATRLPICGAGGTPVSLPAPSAFGSLDEAQQSVDFTIVRPAWLPIPTYQLRWAQVVLGDRVSLYYEDMAVDPKTEGLHDVIIDEQPWADLGAALYVGAVPEERTIDGRPAAFWSASPISCQGMPVVTPAFQQAAWERGDLLIEFGGMGLTPDEIVQIAQSLTDQP